MPVKCMVFYRGTYYIHNLRFCCDSLNDVCYRKRFLIEKFVFEKGGLDLN